MAKNNWQEDLKATLAAADTGAGSGGKKKSQISWRTGNGATPGTTDPAMTADEVRDVVTGRDAVAGGLGLENGPLQVGGAAPNNGFGTGAWRGLVLPGGKSVSNVNALMAMAPGAYQSQYQGAMNGIMNNLLSARPFSYDVNADGLYQQIKDNYMKAGRQAMMDTTGQSAALTGGYGNSYGVTAGNQAYQESLGNLAAAIPELQQLAYSQYEQGLTDQRANLEALNRLDEQAYARWADDAKAYQELMDKLPENYLGGTGGVDPFAGMYGGMDVTTPYNKPGAAAPYAYNMGDVSTWQAYFAANPGAIDYVKEVMANGGTWAGYNNKDIMMAMELATGSPYTGTGKVPTGPVSDTGKKTEKKPLTTKEQIEAFFAGV